jgi:hypothetical protein
MTKNYASDWIEEHNNYRYEQAGTGIVNGEEVPRFVKISRPLIVVLCGSTRFKEEFIAANFRETMAGKIVLSVGLYGHADKEVYNPTEEEKVKLDELHKRKIDLADEVLILNCRRPRCPMCKAWHEWHPPPGNIAGWWQWTCNCHDHLPATEAVPFETSPYIGESTRSELEYAIKAGKVVRFLEDPDQ